MILRKRWAKRKQYEKNRPFADLNTSWWGQLDLNQRPIGYEPTALTAELCPQRCNHCTTDREASRNLSRWLSGIICL